MNQTACLSSSKKTSSLAPEHTCGLQYTEEDYKLKIQKYVHARLLWKASAPFFIQDLHTVEEGSCRTLVSPSWGAKAYGRLVSKYDALGALS
jgi:hypothetical protein